MKSEDVIKNSIAANINKGKILLAAAYTIHNNKLVINANVHNMEMSFVDFVFQVVKNHHS